MTYDDGPASLSVAADVHRGHLRIAERLVRQHGHLLRHAHGLGWLVWDGTRWAPDIDGATVRAVVDVVKRARDELPGLDEQDAKALLADIRASEYSGGIHGVLSIAGSLRPVAVAASRVDGDPYLFNCTNGTLDLRTGELRRHDPRDLITKRSGCEYDPTAESDLFTRFLAEILPDDAVREFVRRLFGYALLGKVTDHVLPIFTGVGGNGKSTLLDVIMRVMGDYAISAEPELLIDRGSSHPTGQADLLGVRLAVTHETDAGRRLAAGTVKRLTGGDRVRARRMRQDFFEFDPSHTLVMVTNHKPAVSGDDQAIWRRICVVPFDWVARQPDTGLGERLTLELPAVLAWCYAGYRAYAERGLTAPVEITERTDAYRVASDALGRFLDEHTHTTMQGSVKARVLFHEWRAWCEINGEPAGSEVTFADAMAARGHEKKRTNGGQMYRGLVLAADEEGRTP